MLRSLLITLTALALAPAAIAQTTSVSPIFGSSSPGTTSVSTGSATFSPSTQEVQFVAPQLIPFAGSTGNFESLVSGLTTGAPVTLATVGADGSVQIVTFTPASAVPAGDAARLLETARQNLISRGVAAPTGAQIAASLMGGTITTASGTSALTGVLTGTSSSPTPVLVRTDAGALQSGAANSNLSAAELAAVRSGLATGTGTTLTTGSGASTRTVVFSPTGVRLSDFEVNQALQLAGTLLAQQGVLNPTPEQLRAALFGGTLAGTNGAVFPVQGVLQGQVRNTSNSTIGVTSTSPSTNTSDSSVAGTSNSSVAGTGTSNSSVAETSNSPLAGTSNSSFAGTSNSAAATANSSIAGTSNSSGTSTSNSSGTSTSGSSIAGTSNSPFAASPGASSAGGSTPGAPLVTRGRR
jgi:hypothetical protein